jgi:arylsulfatase A-like enzyme
MKYTLTVLASLLFASLAASHAVDLLPKKPNIIVIFTDDQTFRGIGYENPEVKTPQLDALSSQGIRFRNCYVASPICAASRASMMTGLFPQQHGVTGLNSAAFAPFRKEEEHAAQAFAARIAEAGYDTAFFGKSHLKDPGSYGFETGREVRGHDDVETFGEATAFIESRKESEAPFFLWLAPRQPHVPLLPEERWLDLYPEGAIRLPGNFRVSPGGGSLNNQGTPPAAVVSGFHLHAESRQPSCRSTA